MKTYKAIYGIDPIILNLDILSSSPGHCDPWGKKNLDGRLDWPHSMFLLLSGIEPRFLGHAARRLVTTSIVLSWIHLHFMIRNLNIINIATEKLAVLHSKASQETYKVSPYLTQRTKYKDYHPLKMYHCHKQCEPRINIYDSVAS